MVILLVLIGAPALLRFFGFAEPSAAILGVLAAICFVMPLDVTQITSVLDFGRIGSEYMVIVVLTVIASLLAGCHAAPRANRPLGWHAQGDAGFIGALLVAIVLGANAFEVAIVNILIAALVIGVALWLAMAGAGALIGRGSSAAVPVASMPKRIGIGISAVVLISYLSVPAVLFGILTPSEAFTFFSLPIAVVFRLVAGLTQGRRMAGYGTDVLRGIADGAWIVLVVFAARTASFTLAFSGSGSPTLALSPMGLMAIFAIAVLALGVIVGPTYGALLAAAIFAPLLTTAGVPHDSCALVFSLTLMLGYASPSFGLSLLSPTPSALARQLSAAEVGAIAVGVVIVVGVSAVIAAIGGSG
jgi:hypothetical protein